MNPTSRLVVGLEIGGHGAHPAAGPPSTSSTPDHLAAAGRRAEAAGFGFLTLGTATDPGAADRLDPVTAAAFVSAHTAAVGLVPVVPTADAEPFHVSNQLSGLDHASGGRAGWWVGTGSSGGDPVALAEEAADVVEASRWLWDSWQDDAVIADEASGRFLDADRVHRVDFRGRSFSVRGPALVPRPPQGQVPVLAPAGALPEVDVAVATAGSVEALLAAEVDAPRVVAEVEVVLDADTPAGERLAALDRHVGWPSGERARWVGDPAGLAAVLRRLAGRVDAVRLLPAVLDVDGAVLAADVLPALGPLLHRPAPGTTLRDLFGLERPAGRYAS
jgi:alkanesulfonate monooxygenase SsuD/methylene tetrahydromethanopterin reductase-like flavin-dependent oxidoreductase (luciferase family)